MVISINADISEASSLTNLTCFTTGDSVHCICIILVRLYNYKYNMEKYDVMLFSLKVYPFLEKQKFHIFQINKLVIKITILFVTPK